MKNSDILLVFDCFGVVVNAVTNEWLKTIPDYKKIEKEVLTIFDKADRGQISLSEVAKRCAKLAHVDPVDVKNYWIDNLRALELVNHLKELKERYTVVMLTNATIEHINKVISMFALEPLFDDIIVSAKEKMAKPDIEFFNLAKNRLNSNYKKIFFMDDNPINVAASYDAGMIGILYKDYDSFIKELLKYIEV